jgi:hypothetical protein
MIIMMTTTTTTMMMIIVIINPQSVLENSNYKLYYDRSIITYGTIRNNRPDTVVLEKIIKESHSIDVGIPGYPNLHSTIVDKLQTYTDLKERLIRI